MRLDPLSVPYRIGLRAGAIASSILLAGVLTGRIEDPTAAATLVVGGVMLASAYELLRYRRIEYDLSPSTIALRTGVFSRREREVPRRRVQTVDVSRNALQRLLGIATVRFDTAGGDGAEITLVGVAGAEADRLRRELGGEVATPDDAGTVFALRGRTFALFCLTSVEAGATAIGSAVVTVTSVPRLVDPSSVGIVVAAIPGRGPGRIVVGIVAVAALAWLLSVAILFVRYYGFRLVRSGDELQYERGLVTRYSGTIPLDKLQTMTVDESVVARRFGYATLRVETASTAGDEGGLHAAVPLARRDRVLRVARSLDPVGEAFDEDLTAPPRRARTRYFVRYGVVALAASVVAAEALVALSASPFAALVVLLPVPVAAHLTWTNRGYATADAGLVTRTGVFVRHTRVAPYYRLQTLSRAATLFQRRRDLATVIGDTAGAGGTGDAVAIDVDADAADRLFATLERRLNRSLAERRRDAGRTPVLTDDPAATTEPTVPTGGGGPTRTHGPGMVTETWPRRKRTTRDDRTPTGSRARSSDGDPTARSDGFLCRRARRVSDDRPRVRGPGAGGRPGDPPATRHRDQAVLFLPDRSTRSRGVDASLRAVPPPDTERVGRDRRGGRSGESRRARVRVPLL
ncbi:hypothetical protein BRD17_05230 [Halobacteriales archaeon SW_7_68_16]|nr:MAG: hypothetical protein BRD17_05230 [Halobacteriales archaeon SW_7_68_16]